MKKVVKFRKKKIETALKRVCPKCKKEIVGTTIGQIEYNMNLHTLAKHKK